MIYNKRHLKFVLPIILFAIVIGCAYNCNLKDKTVFAKNNELKKETEFSSIEKKDVKSINNEHTKIQKDNTKEVEFQDNKNSSKGQSKHINKQTMDKLKTVHLKVIIQ